MSVIYKDITYAGASPSSLIVLSSVLPALGVISTALRFDIRRSLNSRFQMDDWVVLVTLVFVIAMGATAILGELSPILHYPSTLADPCYPYKAFNTKCGVTQGRVGAIRMKAPFMLSRERYAFYFLFVMP